MKKIILLLICCIGICFCTYKYSGSNIEDAKIKMMQEVYCEVVECFMPHILLSQTEGKQLIYQDIEHWIIPMFLCCKETNSFQSALKEQKQQVSLDNMDETMEQQNTQAEHKSLAESENTSANIEDDMEVAFNNPSDNAIEIELENLVEQQETQEEDMETVTSTTAKKVVINTKKLKDFDYLIQNFYQIDNTTTIDEKRLNVERLLEKSLVLKKNVNAPQILIYHTHSQETFKDSKNISESVVAIGDYLTKLLKEEYGLNVMHHRGQYDVNDRDHAYSNALPAIKDILEENPSIEVVIDLHRDGVAETTHLVTEIEGRPTAKIMFFNGLSYTTARGELTYLKNPYIEDNLAFSLQMQIMAEEYYPSLTRKIYLKGYRYNMHLCAKSLLVEVGAQTNSFEEAKNAMIPLADILAKALKGEKE